MTQRPLILSALIATWLMLSAFDFPCFILCTDQTSTQRAYVGARDKCRETAEMRASTLEAGPVPMEDKQRKTRLVALFSECMGANGWAVPGPSTETAAKEPSKPTQEQVESGIAETARQRELTRTKECAYARQAIKNSRRAAALAAECDRECAQRLSMAPDTRPAACPPQEDTGKSVAAPIPVGTATLLDANVEKKPGAKPARAHKTAKPAKPRKSAAPTNKPAPAETAPAPEAPMPKSGPEAILEEELHR